MNESLHRVCLTTSWKNDYMKKIFKGAKSFDQQLDNWDFSSVEYDVILGIPNFSLPYWYKEIIKDY